MDDESAGELRLVVQNAEKAVPAASYTRCINFGKKLKTGRIYVSMEGKDFSAMPGYKGAKPRLPIKYKVLLGFYH